MSDRLTDLEEMRELLWASVKQADPEKRAPLFARLESVIEQIDKLAPTAKAGDPVDEIAKRRAARGAGSAAAEGRATQTEG